MRKNRIFILGLTAMMATGASAEVTLSDVVGDSPLYGYLLNEDAATAKWNKINGDGTVATVWEDTNLSETGFRMLSGWMKEGILCGYGLQMSGNYALGFGYMERNVVTGDVYSQEVEKYSSVPKDKSFNSAVYQKADDTIYGYGSSSNSMAFKKTSGNGDFRSSEVLFQLTDPYEWCPSLCIDPATGQMYGISLGQSESLLLSIDEEGFSDVVATLPVKSGNATSALAYFPETGYFLWSNVNGGVSALYAIRLSDGSCEKISDLDPNEHYGFFVTDSHADGSGIPAMPELLVNRFEAPSTSGSIIYFTPDTDLAGTGLEAENDELEWVATLDKKEYKTGVITMGSTVMVEYKDLEEGLHTFGFYAKNGDLRSGSLNITEYIGYDIPLAPQNVTLELDGSDKIIAKWDAVEGGVHNGYVDLEAMEYKVYLNDDFVATVKEPTWSGSLDPDATLTANMVTVIASSKGRDSASASSNAIVAGKPFGPNVFFAPSEADASLMTYPSDDGLRWKYNTSFDPAVFSVSSKYGSDDPLSTWLIFPAIDFPDAAKTYRLDYQNGTYADYDDEFYEIWIGKEPAVEAMTTNILEKTQVGPTNSFASDLEWNKVATEFKVPEKGVWYIGFKACSDAHKTGQVLLNIRVSTLSGVNDIIGDNSGERAVAAYYDARGVRLSGRPSEGFYIIVYTDGTTEKCMATR